jgi:hypothetical protein
VGPLVCFIHIERTGGSTLNGILQQAYGRKAYVNVGNRTDLAAAVGRVREIGASRGEVRALHGHVPFGVRRYLPRDTRYVTILRDPVERTLSHWGWLVAARTRDLRPQAAALVPPEGMGLEQGLAEGYILDNWQTRMLSGELDLSRPCGEEQLAKARKNVRRFAAVGITEDFDALLRSVRDALGLEQGPFERRAVNDARPQVADLSDVEAEAVREHTALDALLYDSVRATARERPGPRRS